MLRPDVPIDLKLGSALRLHNACMRIYCPTSKTWADANPKFSPYLAASTDLDIPSAHVTVQLTALGLSRQRTSLVGVFEGVTLGRLEHLVDLAGGNDLASYLPDDVRAAASVLEGLGLRQSRSISTPDGAGVRRGDGRTRQSEHQGVARLHGRQPDGQLSVFEPFGPQRAVSVMVGGHVQFATAPLDVAIELPEVLANARTTDTVSVPISALVRDAGIQAPDMPDLPINQLQMEIAGDGSFAVFASVAAAPPWTLDLGPTSLTVKDIIVGVMHPAGDHAPCSRRRQGRGRPRPPPGLVLGGPAALAA